MIKMPNFCVEVIGLRIQHSDIVLISASPKKSDIGSGLEEDRDILLVLRGVVGLNEEFATIR
jgi:hypothetical protein